jgi:hypothetical protein
MPELQGGYQIKTAIILKLDVCGNWREEACRRYQDLFHSNLKTSIYESITLLL